MGRAADALRARRPSAAVAAAGLAAVAALALAAPRIWLEPLHVDEQVTLSVAPRSLGRMLDEIFVEKGGSPVHFLVERATLAWPGGLVGLRGPSVLFLLLALPGIFLLARELLSELEAAVATSVAALAPLASDLATFARMYTLFLAVLAWGTWYAFARADRGRGGWAVAGALLGLGVYVHPIAPLYGAAALAAAAVYTPRPVRTLVARSWIAVPAFAAVGLPYYAHALPRLRERYYVEYPSSKRLTATHGRSVAEDILDALTPLGGVVATAFAALALAGLVALLARRPRTGLAIALAVGLPVLFFSLVSVGEPGPGGTRFFARYVLPLVPWIGILVAAGCAAAARVVGGPSVFAVLALAAVGAEGIDDYRRLDRLRSFDLRGAVATIDRLGLEAVVFSATGRPTDGRPAQLLDELVALQLADAERVPEEQGAGLTAYARRCERGIGAWILAGSRGRVDAAAARLRRERDVRVAFMSRRFLVAASARPGSSTELLGDGTTVRRVWREVDPRDRRAQRLLRADEAELARVSCPTSRG